MTGGPGPGGSRTRRAGALDVLHWPALDALGAEVVVTTRHGGVSTGPYASLDLALHVGDRPEAVVDNRRRAAAAIGAGLGDLVFADQAHGSTATVVGRADRGRGALDLAGAVPATDALVTADPGTVLVILVADCVPLVLYDPAARVLAAVHAGWRGTVARAADAALGAMTALGARPARVVAGLGPAVSPRVYEVGDDVAGAFERTFGPAARAEHLVVPAGTAERGEGAGHDDRTRGRWLVDLPRANRRILVDAGVPPGAVHLASATTGPGGPFYSDRAARPCGRFGLLARIGAGPPAAAAGGDRTAARP